MQNSYLREAMLEYKRKGGLNGAAGFIHGQDHPAIIKGIEEAVRVGYLEPSHGRIDDGGFVVHVTELGRNYLQSLE